MIFHSKSEIAALLGNQAFVKFADADDALFVSDAPRRLRGEAFAQAVTALQGQGFAAWVSQNGLLFIDWGEARWQLWAASATNYPGAPIPADTALLPVYRLARLYAAHPAPWLDQPKAPIRALLKRVNRKEAFIACAQSLHRTGAGLLREHKPLPRAAAGLLWQWLSQA